MNDFLKLITISYSIYRWLLACSLTLKRNKSAVFVIFRDSIKVVFFIRRSYYNINCVTIRIYCYRHTCTPTTTSIFRALKFPCVCSPLRDEHTVFFMRMLRLCRCAVVEDTYLYGRTYSLGTFITTKRKCPFLPRHIRGQAAILHCSCAKKPGDERRPEVL